VIASTTTHKTLQSSFGVNANDLTDAHRQLTKAPPTWKASSTLDLPTTAKDEVFSRLEQARRKARFSPGRATTTCDVGGPSTVSRSKPDLVCDTPDHVGQPSVLRGCDTVTAIISAAEIEASIGSYIRRVERALRTLPPGKDANTILAKAVHTKSRNTDTASETSH
jgi:hypothetical protein